MKLFSLLSPGGHFGRLSIFIFHRVLPRADPLMPGEPDAERFDRIVGLLARHYRLLPLGTASRLLQQGKLPAAAASITFDDGYADNLTVASPALLRHGVQATIFVATGYIDGGRMWNDSVIEAVRRMPKGRLDWEELGAGSWILDDAASRARAVTGVQRALKYMQPARRQEITREIERRAELPARGDLMLSRQQVLRLREIGMEIGGHTITHPILRNVDAAAARDEIGGGREMLTSWLGEAPTLFAYPNGVPDQDYTARDVQLVAQAGYRTAVSTAAGVASMRSDLLQLPRFTPWDRNLVRFALRSARNLAGGVRHAVAESAA